MDVSSAVHFTAEAWKFITVITIKNCCKMWFFQLIMSVNSDYYDLKIINMKKMIDSFEPLEMEFENYMTCDSTTKVCGVYSVGQVFNQQFRRPGEELEEEAAECKGTFVDVLTSL